MTEITIQQKISMALAHEGMTQAELARRFGSSPPAFKQRLNNGKFTQEELEKIASILNAKYYSGFKFNDGAVIE